MKLTIVILEGMLADRTIVIKEGVAVAFEYVPKEFGAPSVWRGPDAVMRVYLRENDISFVPDLISVDPQRTAADLIAESEGFDYIYA